MKKIRNIKELQYVTINGHNSDELLKKYVISIASLERKKAEIVSQIKEEKMSAKEDGLLVTAIAGAVKDLMKTQEQRDARSSVEVERERIFNLCCDLPLFKAAA